MFYPNRTRVWFDSFYVRLITMTAIYIDVIVLTAREVK